MTPYELLLGVLAAGTNVDGRMGTNGVPLRAVIPPVTVCILMFDKSKVYLWQYQIVFFLAEEVNNETRDRNRHDCSNMGVRMILTRTIYMQVHI